MSSHFTSRQRRPIFFALLAMLAVWWLVVPVAGAMSGAAIRKPNLPPPTKNSPPIIEKGAEVITLSISEDNWPAPFDLTLSAVDVDGDALSWSIAAPPKHGTAEVELTGNQTPVFYRPVTDYSGSDVFVVSVTDTRGSSDSVSIEIKVEAVNDAPQAFDSSIVLVEDAQAAFAVENFPWADVDAGDTLRYIQIEAAPTAGVLYLDLNQSGMPEPGEAVSARQILGTMQLSDLRFSPAPDASGAPYAELKWRAGDGQALSENAARLAIHILAANDVPVIENGADTVAVTMSEDSEPVTFQLTLTAVDADGDPLYWNIAAAAQHGQALVQGSGSTGQVGYKPAIDFSGTDQFEVRVSDQHGGEDTVLVIVTVEAVNDAPTSADVVLSTPVNTDLLFSSASFPFADVDGDTLQAVCLIALPEAGWLYLDLNGDGSVNDGEMIAAGQCVAYAHLNLLKFKPAPDETGRPYAEFWFLVNDGATDAENAAVATVEVIASSLPAASGSTPTPEIPLTRSARR